MAYIFQGMKVNKAVKEYSNRKQILPKIINEGIQLSDDGKKI